MIFVTANPGATVRSQFWLRKNYTNHKEGKSRPGRFIGRKQRGAVTKHLLCPPPIAA